MISLERRQNKSEESSLASRIPQLLLPHNLSYTSIGHFVVMYTVNGFSPFFPGGQLVAL